MLALVLERIGKLSLREFPRPRNPGPRDPGIAEAVVRPIFRNANVCYRAIALMVSGKIDLKPLITATFALASLVAAFGRAVEARPTDVKLQIELLH